MKLTKQQQKAIEVIKLNGGVIGVAENFFFIPMTGQKMHAMVINNLIGKQILTPSNDGLFTDFNTQTYSLIACNSAIINPIV